MRCHQNRGPGHDTGKNFNNNNHFRIRQRPALTNVNGKRSPCVREDFNKHIHLAED